MIITSLYGIKPPSASSLIKHENKLAEAIIFLGNKYLLAKPITKADANGKH
jgi:hypothetical protein